MEIVMWVVGAFILVSLVGYILSQGGSVHENRQQIFTTSEVTSVSLEIELLALRDIEEKPPRASPQLSAAEGSPLDATE
ncbi:hypothetical protein ABT034_33070 [Streptomyces sp. NPDC002773]|uniref:hypothetical protein n=1 Tax=Streptomyces sp. NPDC002773 TaxID=3154430 RepID=UPI0033291E60